MIAVMPMAGRGSRFLKAGVSTPKPFIDVLGKPMFIRSLESLGSLNIEKIYFVVLIEHFYNFNIVELIETHTNLEYQVVLVNQVTEGQLQTVLLTKNHIKEDKEILVLPSDTVIIDNLKSTLSISQGSATGVISLIEKPGNQWSFAKLNKNNSIIEVAEKKRISDFVSTGMYYFRSSSDFFNLAEILISNNERTSGEYYIIPVYQKMIDRDDLVLPSFATQMWDMGNPIALAEYINFLLGSKLTNNF
jgi:dTDP-glucose pyrophosphorylase